MRKLISQSAISKLYGILNKTSDIEKKKELLDIKEQSERTNQVAMKKSQEALKKAKSGLSNAKTQVDTPDEQKVISKMFSTVSKVEADPAYDASSDVALVKADYEKLDSHSQNRVKVALVTNVDPSSIGILRQTFGM